MAIYFKLHRSGNVVRASADGGAPFFVGRITQYADKSSGEDFTGLFYEGLSRVNTPAMCSCL